MIKTTEDKIIIEETGLTIEMNRSMYGRGVQFNAQNGALVISNLSEATKKDVAGLGHIFLENNPVIASVQQFLNEEGVGFGDVVVLDDLPEGVEIQNDYVLYFNDNDLLAIREFEEEDLKEADARSILSPIVSVSNQPDQTQKQLAEGKKERANLKAQIFQQWLYSGQAEARWNRIRELRKEAKES